MFSDRLLRLDGATGQATEIARIQGTIQGDVDALVFVGATLFAVDAAAGHSTLYRIDKQSGVATALGGRFDGTVIDLAFDPETRRLLAAVEGDARLVAIELEDGLVTEIGSEIDAPIKALAFQRAIPTGLLQDDFESGDLSSWSLHQSGEQ